MAEDGSQGEATNSAERVRRPRVRILFAFLASFAVLLVVFHEVLFPFLMAIYISYLIEPVVSRTVRSRLFGLKWTRGPAIVVIYVVVLGGLAVLGWVGITKLATTVRDTSRDIAASLQEDGHRALFEYVAPAPPLDEDGAEPPAAERAVIVPQGTALHIRGIPFKTLFKVRLDHEQRKVSVLLEHARKSDHTDLKFTAEDPVKLMRAKDLRYAGGEEDEEVVADDLARLSITPGGSATGLEFFAEREFISPIVKNLAGVGFDVEPTLVRDFIKLQGNVAKEDLPERIGKTAVVLAGKLVLSVYKFFLILMLTAFIVMDRRSIGEFFASLPPPNHKAAYQKLVGYIDDGLAGVIRGQLVICGVNGLLTYMGLLILGVPYAVFLSTVAAVFSLIPVFGTIISSVPIVLIAATDGIDTGLYALVWIVIIHAIEANVLNPLIMGSHARMHPVIIIFALLAGEHSFGIWGALLAVPTMSIIQSCFRYYLHEIEGLPTSESDEHDGWLGTLWGKIKARFSGEREATDGPTSGSPRAGTPEEGA